jgi:thiosulfate reductase cytochrome b subunit
MMTCLQKCLRLVVICLLLGLFCSLAFGGGVRAFNYRGGGQGPVTFDHRMHASKGYSCQDCHMALPATGQQLFQTQKQGMITFDDHSGNAKCFACHNSKVAFSECGQCHRK